VSDERDEIRQKVDIVSLVSREVALKKTGRNFVGLCPFHPDKNPSMTVNPLTGRYKCWSCGAGGDIFNWVMARQNVDFAEALRVLAKDAGIELHQRDPEAAKRRRDRDTAMDTALQVFRESLALSRVAQDYLHQRQIPSDAVKAWELGYAPDQSDTLTSRLLRDGFPLAESKLLFLVDTDASGGYYDKFRGRLMFPIRDERGALVAFGGRIIGNGQPKYINSSDTPLFRKSRVLYGMNLAKGPIQDSRRALLVEGYLDVIACHTAGIRTAVASLGTALAEEQADLLRRWCDHVVILYDADEAGQKATERALGVLASVGLQCTVALMPAGQDPDSLLKQQGAAGVQAVVDAAIPPIDFLLKRLGEKFEVSDDRFWAEVPDVVSRAKSELELDRYLMRLAPQYPGIADPIAAVRALRAMVLRRKRELRTGSTGQPSSAPTARLAMTSREMVVFAALVTIPLRREAYMFSRATNLFTSPLAVQLSKAVSTAFPDGPPTGPLSLWIHRIEPESLREALSEITDDIRGQNVDHRVLIDALQQLKEHAAARVGQELKAGDKAGYFGDLKRRKGLPDSEGSEDVEDLFDGT